MTYSKLFLALGFAGVLAFTDVRIESHGSMPPSIGFAGPAAAEIGRPLTPLSYAGVARRTTRRVVRTTTTIAVLPAGCRYGPYYGGYYYRCGSYYYAKSGNIYVQVIVQ